MVAKDSEPAGHRSDSSSAGAGGVGLGHMWSDDTAHTSRLNPRSAFAANPARTGALPDGVSSTPIIGWLAPLSLALVQSAVTPDTRPAVLVTGANRGIGLEIARGFGALGHRVVLAALAFSTGATGQSCSVLQLNLATKRTWSERLS